MLIVTRTLITGSCLALIAVAGCGGRVSGPTEPSGSGSAGATITGTVNGGNMISSTASAVSAGLTAAAAPSGMTVTVAGTNLTTSVDVLGQFQLAGVPSGNVQLEFKNGSVSASVQLSNVGEEELVQIQVSVSGTAATIVNEVRTSGKVRLCHVTGNGSYHLIEVSVSAEPAHRAHGDGAVGDRVPADPTKVFDANCQAVAATAAAVRIKKSTNGQDADEAPGPTIVVGSPVAWQYVVTNTGQVGLTNVAVADDKGVVVSCTSTTLAVGQSMTCTGSGVATLGQYTNVGTVTANSVAGPVKDSDASHYLGQLPGQVEGRKVQICHRTGNGQYHLIEISINAEPAHRAHGDAKVGEPVPGSPGKVFTASCGVS